MFDFFVLYAMVGPIVGVLGVYALCKAEPIGRPDDFGEFMLNCLMVTVVWAMMSLFWPITVVVGICWVIYQYLYEDTFKTSKGREL